MSSTIKLRDETASRRLILGSFWSLIVLALPFWYYAVSVERASLPDVRVHDWSARAPCFFGSDACYQQLVDARVVKYSRNYNLLLTLLNEDAAQPGALLAWDIEALIAKHIDPILSELDGLHNVSISTTINHFAPLAVPVHALESGGVAVEEDDLKAFINSADWSLPSAINLDPTVHMLVYVPTSANQPMRIRTASGHFSDSTSFLVPQWGALALHDASRSLDDAFDELSTAMRTLFGLDSEARLVEARIAETAKDAVRSLDAIVTLANSIENMRVTQSVQRGVMQALDELDKAQRLLPGDPEAAVRHTALAQELATKAYYDPNMLALLYFPDEHKYAIYTPLFGPVAVPLVVSLIKEWKAFKERRRRRRRRDDSAPVGVARVATHDKED